MKATSAPQYPAITQRQLDTCGAAIKGYNKGVVDFALYTRLVDGKVTPADYKEAKNIRESLRPAMKENLVDGAIDTTTPAFEKFIAADALVSAVGAHLGTQGLFSTLGEMITDAIAKRTE